MSTIPTKNLFLFILLFFKCFVNKTRLFYSFNVYGTINDLILTLLYGFNVKPVSDSEFMEKLCLKTWFLWFKPCSSFKCVKLMEYIHSVFFSFLKIMNKHLLGFLVKWYSTCMMKHLVTIRSTCPNVYWKQWGFFFFFFFNNSEILSVFLDSKLLK